MNIACTGCQGVLVVGEDRLGKTVLCAKCGAITRITEGAPNDAPASKGAISLGTPPAGTDHRVESSRRSRDYDEDDDDSSWRRRRPPRLHAPSNGGQKTVLIVVAVAAVAIFLVLPCVSISMLGFIAQVEEERAVQEMRVAEEMEMEMVVEARAHQERAIVEHRLERDFPEIAEPIVDGFKKDTKIAITRDIKFVTVKQGRSAEVRMAVTVGKDLKGVTMTADVEALEGATKGILVKLDPARLLFSGEVTVSIIVADDAAAGDYQVTITAASAEAMPATAFEFILVTVEKTKR